MIVWDEQLQQDFNDVISYSQGGFSPSTDKVFIEWAKNKEWMYHALGDQLIYEFPQTVQFELDENTKNTHFSQFIMWVNDYSESLAEFLTYQKFGFYDNKTIMDWQDIPAGMKLSKAIGRYWKDEISSYSIDAIQTEFSRIIQLNKISGKLCMSIHPLDFLSISENQHNWRSCHALDGEYCAGNISYMMDNCTIITYLKSDDNIILPRFPSNIPWNNKKWRCLLFIDQNRQMIYAGRQYPFFTAEALNSITNDLLVPTQLCKGVTNKMEWLHNCVGSIYQSFNNFSTENHIIINDEAIKLNTWVMDIAPLALHYNDLLRSSVYLPWTLNYGNFSLDELKAMKPLIIGATVPCLYCSEKEAYESDAMLCVDCAIELGINVDWLVRCDQCDTLILRDKAFCSEEYGAYYCNDCLINNTFTCADCGVTVNILLDDYGYNSQGEIICRDCYDHQIEKY